MVCWISQTGTPQALQQHHPIPTPQGKSFILHGFI